MKVKNLLSVVFLAAGLTFILPTAVPFAGGTGQSFTAAAEEKNETEKESETEKTPESEKTTESEKEFQDGWSSDAGGWFYLSNGTRLTGLQQIGSDFYYFDTKGYRVTGAVIVQSKLHYFNPGTGKLVTGVSGLQRIGTSSDYYFFRKTLKRKRRSDRSRR